MKAAILDTNVFRSLNDSEFAKLLELEARAGVYPVVDSWTIMELLAGLAATDAPEVRAYEAAIRRLADRSLRGNGHLVLPYQAQARKLLLDEQSLDHKERAQYLADTALWAASVTRVDEESVLLQRCRDMALHVSEVEQRFATDVTELGLALKRGVEELGGTVGRDLRRLLRSTQPLEQSARILIEATLRQSGRPVPKEIPQQAVHEVVDVFRTGFVAMAMALERIHCDGANVESDRIRNLVWDQNIAANVGHHLGEFPVLVVTDDRFFADAARRTGHTSAVATHSEYAELLIRGAAV